MDSLSDHCNGDVNAEIAVLGEQLRIVCVEGEAIGLLYGVLYALVYGAWCRLPAQTTSMS